MSNPNFPIVFLVRLQKENEPLLPKAFEAGAAYVTGAWISGETTEEAWQSEGFGEAFKRQHQIPLQVLFEQLNQSQQCPFKDVHVEMSSFSNKHGQTGILIHNTVILDNPNVGADYFKEHFLDALCQHFAFPYVFFDATFSLIVFNASKYPPGFADLVEQLKPVVQSKIEHEQLSQLPEAPPKPAGSRL